MNEENETLYNSSYIETKKYKIMKSDYMKLKNMHHGGGLKKVSKFTNELGNKITIKIKNYKDNGINYKTKEKIHFDGVSMSIIGPSSMAENIITYKEAEELYYALKKFLNK